MQDTEGSSLGDITGLCEPNNTNISINLHYAGPSYSGIYFSILIANGNAILTANLTQLSDTKLTHE